MAETNSCDLFPGALEMIILDSPRRESAHGHALVQHTQQRSNNLQVEEGSLYPALQRLLKGESGEGRVGTLLDQWASENLSITAAGLRRLEQQISSLEGMFEGISLVLNPGRATTS